MNNFKLLTLEVDDFNHLIKAINYSSGLIEKLEKSFNKLGAYGFFEDLLINSGLIDYDELFFFMRPTYEFQSEQFDLDVVKEGNTLRLNF